jgi:hypothetical protein
MRWHAYVTCQTTICLFEHLRAWIPRREPSKWWHRRLDNHPAQRWMRGIIRASACVMVAQKIRER